MVAHLERSDEGRNFLREFRAYLDEFGWRSEAFELADPTWRENPPIPLNTSRAISLLTKVPIPMSASMRQSKPEKDCWTRRGSGWPETRTSWPASTTV